MGCTQCQKEYDLHTYPTSETKECRKRCKEGEFRNKTTDECTSCLQCEKCQIGEILICPECDFCVQRCELKLLKIKKSEFVVEGIGIVFNLHQIRESNPLKDYSIEPSDRGNSIFWFKSLKGVKETVDLIIPRSALSTMRCIVPRPIKMIIEFEDDTERKFNQSVKDLGSVVGASAVAISFVSIANVNSFHSLIVIINTNKVFNYMFVLDPDIKGVLRYINQIDTLLNFESPDMFMRLIFPYDSESWKHAVHASVNFKESLIQEKSFFGFKLFIISGALPLIWFMNKYFKYLKRIYLYLSKITPANMVQQFSRLERTLKRSYYKRIYKEFRNRKKWLFKMRKFIVFKFFGSRNRYIFSLLSIFAPDFGHILAKLVMYCIHGNAKVRLICFVFILIWLALISTLVNHVSTRFLYLWRKSNFKPRQKKEFSLYLKNISFIIKVFFMVFFFLIFSKWVYLCLVIQIILQCIDMYTRFRFAFIDCRRTQTLSIFFELLIENLITCALILLLSSYKSENSSKFILSFDIFMIMYNVAKTSLFLFRIVFNKESN